MYPLADPLDWRVQSAAKPRRRTTADEDAPPPAGRHRWHPRAARQRQLACHTIGRVAGWRASVRRTGFRVPVLATPKLVAFATVEATYRAWGAPLKQLDPDTMPRLQDNSPPGFYRGPRGGVVEVTDWGTQRQWKPATARKPASQRRTQPGSSVRSHVTALERWAQVYRQRDDLIRAASAAGVGVNEIARITGIAKTTVIRVLRK